jgi:ABC-2 type transport system ATP-binding protein
MMIQIHELYKAYGNVVAIDRIDLNIRENVVTGLLGPNGAGKTTLVSILTGIIEKNGGRVTVGGLDLDASLSEIQSMTGIVPQTLAFYPMLSAFENLEYFGALYGLRGKKLRERIEFSVDVASLRPFLNRRAGAFSGGMQRRLNLAIGLLNDPKILYLDEPTVGVDAQSRQYMLEMIRKINIEHGTTIVFASHYIGEIQQTSDDIIIIDDGKITLHERMDSILASEAFCTIEIDPHIDIGKEKFPWPGGLRVEEGKIFIDCDSAFYQNFIHALSVLRDRGIEIHDIHYNKDKLEELYLRLTSTRLRDDE